MTSKLGIGAVEYDLKKSLQFGRIVADE
jgi:hypothetical protein